LAPTRTDLRKAFIDQLTNDQRIPEAIAQYAQLLEAAPGNPDFLREWGRLVLRNKEVPEAERKQEASRIWSQILIGHADDALTIAQVADLFRQNKMNEEAEPLYRRAVELAPGDPQYREYLGEFLHLQSRSDEALSVWEGIAAGDRRTAVNVARLAEVYHSFGFAGKAVSEIADAVLLDPKDFSLQIRAASYHSTVESFDQAMAYVDAAEQIAATDDERDTCVQQRIEILQAQHKLETVAAELVNSLTADPNATAEGWYTAARYLEAARQWSQANAAIDRAIAIAPQSVPVMTLAARIAESSGDFGRAVTMNRALAETDRRSRGDYLMAVSRLEAQLGRSAEALAAAQELIVSAPGNTDHYEFLAQMCFRLGKSEDGLNALRKAVRINPNEPHLIMALGSALSDQLRTDEAIEVYWRAFEKSEDVEDKVTLTMKLTPLYQQINQLDKLVERFERDRREEEQRRAMTICLAQAWHTAGDIVAARQELESLLSEDTRDTNLLSQLAKLCQDGGELEAAIGYQRQLVSIAPGHETEFPLATMLRLNGNLDEAAEILVRLTRQEEDPVRQLRAIDSLLSQGQYEAVISITEPLLAQNREDWELLYREGVAWHSLDKPEEALSRFERILSLSIPYDALGRAGEEQLKQAQAKARSGNRQGITTSMPQRPTPLSQRTNASEAAMACGLISDRRYFSGNQLRTVWTPAAYGTARMAAIGWVLRYRDDILRLLADGQITQNPDDPD
ncbi:MAG: tetratricopeptide repeat protein, partial [Planctomycetaceae bacterium]|nr:tetratricopeptide repeat protein [Planctomycetaceae bacterium]